MRLQGKVALITGSGRGQGRTAAILFAKEGAVIVVNDVNVKCGQETVEMIKDVGSEAIFVEADISKTADVQKMIDAATNSFGKLDVLYNNAGVFWPHKGDVPVTELDEDIWDKVLSINLKGVYLCCKYGIRELIRNQGGSVINMASIAGIIGADTAQAYVAAKGGVISLTRSLAVQYAPHHVRANVICPGAMDTPMLDDVLRDPTYWYTKEQITEFYPLGKIGAPEDVAYLAVYLASEESSFVTGSVFVVDGGYTAR
jgi:NAD(P)-dependent dehydrogenase (short-subunit alcohol dehydrogenase family)